MKPKQITIRDVAKAAGVSVATVSRALNGLGGIGDETREHVLKVCEQMAYVPNTLARGLVMQHTQTLGIVMPDITSPFYSRLMVLAAQEAKRYGYQVLLCYSFRDYETEIDYFKLLIGNQVEGILFFPVGDLSSKNLYQFLRYIPIVALNEMPEFSPIPYVCCDERAGGRMAVDYLLDCGCKSLVFVGLKEDRLAHRYRMESFLKGTNRDGIFAEVLENGESYKSSFERGYGQFSEFLEESGKLPDGVVAVSDATANGVIKACMERKISIPEQISLIGFDNINGDLPRIELTTVAVSQLRLLRQALDLLIKVKEKGKLSSEQSRIRLCPELFERGSCSREKNK